MRRPATPTLVAIGLLIVHASLGVWHAWTTSATYDETTHIASGYLTWVTGDHRLNPEHPPTAKLWATLPLLAIAPWPSAAALQDPDSLGPLGSDRRRLQEAWAGASTDFLQQWIVGSVVLYGKSDAVTSTVGRTSASLPPAQALRRADFLNDADRLVRVARLPIIVISATLGWLLFAWTRRLFGSTGGLLALALFALDPNQIAHGSLVTTDVPLACFMFASLFAWWRLLGDLSRRNVIAALGWPVLAVTTKLTAILLVPMLVACALIRIHSAAPWSMPSRWQGVSRTRWGRAMLLAGLAGATAVCCYAGIWGVYGFRFAMARPTADGAVGSPPLRSVLLATARTKALLDSIPTGAFTSPPLGDLGSAVALDPGSELLAGLHRHRILPEAFLYGTAIARLYALRRVSFLDEEISSVGFRRYFAVAVLLKTPLLTLLLVMLGSIAWLRRQEVDAQTRVALLVPIATYAASALSASLNIGFRHLLPLLPFGVAFAGALPSAFAAWGSHLNRRWRGGVAVLALGLGTQFTWDAGTPRPIAPHFLAYFNELAGGPDGGRHHLVDSNLDWGQDLPALAEWLRVHAVPQPINLCYFGTADPRWHGIRYRAMPGCDFVDVPGATFHRSHHDLPETIAPLEPSGWLVVSATLLSGTYFSEYGRSRWREFLASYAVPVDTVGHTMFIYRIRREAY